MTEHVRVKIVSRTVDADPETLKQRQDIVERLRDLGQLDGDGDIDRTTARWFARFGEVEVPLDAFEVQPPELGRKALVSLLIAADSVQVGDVEAAAPQVQPVEEKQVVSTWGAPGMPDPRENIPGWKPEHDHTVARWTCGCDPVLLGIADAAAKTGNIDLQVMGNTAGRLA